MQQSDFDEFKRKTFIENIFLPGSFGEITPLGKDGKYVVFEIQHSNLNQLFYAGVMFGLTGIVPKLS